MKQSTTTLSAFGLLSSFVFAGTVAIETTKPVPTACADGFAQARRPISNPTLFDLALPTTNIHPIFIYQGLPGLKLTEDESSLMEDRLTVDLIWKF